MRNALLLAIAPTATIASIAGVYECVEPQVSNLFKRETLSGEFLQVNPYLVADLKRLGRWDADTREALREANGSVEGFGLAPGGGAGAVPHGVGAPAARPDRHGGRPHPVPGPGQSLNLFLETPTIGKLSSMYAYAWKSGLKTTYYLRSRPATRIARAARAQRPAAAPAPTVPTPRRSPAPLRTPSPARPASDDRTTRDAVGSEEPARPGLRADPAAHALPRLLRALPGRHQEHLDVEEVDLHSDVADLAKLDARPNST